MRVTSRGEPEASPITRWSRASRSLQASNGCIPSMPSTIDSSSAHCSGVARSAARAAAPPSTTARSVARSSSAAAVGASAAGKRSTAAPSVMKVPPPRPRRVSISPALRSTTSALRNETAEMPRAEANCISAGRRSPGRSSPSPIASPSRATVSATAPAPRTGVKTVRSTSRRTVSRSVSGAV